MNIFTEFGIQPVLLVAQAVNFLILLFILKRFLYGPILKMLDTRKQKIAQSLKEAEEIEKKLAQTEEDREKKLAKALEEGKQIIEEAKSSAVSIIAQAHEKANLDIENLLKKSQEEISSERDKMRSEVRDEVSRLVVAGLKAVSGKVLTQKDRDEILKKSIKDIHE